ncbi:unnamed protein product [Moneuplotes crassus]|uniref:Uncharacterized protein n=1 Tax=Euplotes crassus TaxID=5936 RepID=A0AAD2D2G6_EUPCR|nr:unnamed protein product [Moneuplotes crassus]
MGIRSNLWRLILLCSLFFCVLIKCQTCGLGEFEEYGHCFQCHASCKQCEGFGQCTSCKEGFVVNETTGLCDYKDCPDRQFYSIPLEKCVDCENSCNQACAYQSHCFECPTGQVLDLDTVQCVTECDSEGDSSAQVLIQDPQMGNIPVCRSFDYYVNINSESPVELGTKSHPYKHIDSALVETMNFHSHSERNITIYVMEGTTVFINTVTYFVNITHVQIEAYNDNGNTLGLARMVGIQDSYKVIGAAFPTKFNALSDKTFKTGEMLFDNNGFDSNDKLGLLVQNALFKPFHAGLIVKNFRVVTDYEGQTLSHMIFEPYRVDKRVLGMINCDLRIHGSFLRAFTTVFNWHMENIVLETQYLYRFSVIGLNCGPDGTDMGTGSYFKNFTAINSGGKPSYLHGALPLFRHHISNNAHYEDIYIDTYIGYFPKTGQLVFYYDPINCFITNSNTWNFTNVHITSSRHEEGKNIKFISTSNLVFAQSAPVDGTLHIHCNNITFSNDRNEFIGLFVSWSTIDTIYHVNGLHFKNTDGFLLNMRALIEVDYKNVTFENVTSDLPYMAYHNLVKRVEFDGLTIDGLIDPGSYQAALFHNNVFNVLSFVLKNFEVRNSQILNRKAIFFTTGKSDSTYVVTNAKFYDTIIGGDTALLSYGIFSQVNITNVHVLRTHPLQQGEHFTIKSDYTGGGLAPSSVQIFKDIIIEQSSVSVLVVSKPDAATNVTQSLSITNITYKDLETDLALELIKIYRMSTLGSYSISIQDVVFSNLTFKLSSKLMYFQQQLLTSALVANVSISNTVNAGITVEAYATNEFYNSTHVTFSNIKATNIDGRARSLVNIYKGAEIEILNSDFSFIGNSAKGAVLSAGAEKAIAVLRNCTFWNNTAVEGAVFESESLSRVKCYNCTFFNNFAISGGVLKASADGIFELYNSTIYNNFALAGAVSELFSSQIESIVSDCNITSNFGLTEQEIKENILPQGYIYQSFRDYLAANQYLYESETSFSCFKMIMAKISISNTNFIQQKYVLHATGSRISIKSSVFKDITLVSNLLSISESDVEMSNTIFMNLTCNDNSQQLILFVKAFAEIDQLDYSNSNCKLINSGLSQVYLMNSNIKNISVVNNNLISLLNSKSTDLNNEKDSVETSIISSSFFNISTTSGPMIYMKDCGIQRIFNSTFIKTNTQALRLLNTNVSTISACDFIENKECINAIRTNLGVIDQCKFELCGDLNVKFGGAVNLEASESKILRSNFSQNQAESGAAISIQCSFGQTCVNEFQDLEFVNNTAAEVGAGIYYNMHRPVMQSISNTGNVAKYGPDVASYPVRIVQRGTNRNKVLLDNVASGLQYKEKLEFDLVDYDGQIMNLESSNTIKILIEDSRISIKGTDFGKLVNGQTELANLIFIGEVGLQNVKYMLTSKAIDQRILNEVLDNEDGTYDNYIEVSFRYCNSGEIQTENKQCEECNPSTYSFGWNSTSCLPCMDFVSCSGEDQIIVDKGYWRKTANSSTIIECPNEQACEGGYHPNNVDHPVKCSKGYKGILCTECDIVDGIKYQPLSNFSCTKCPDPLMNTIRVILVSLIAFMFLMLLIYVNLRKKKESQLSILFRILTNYLHLITAFFTFGFNLPNSFKGLFSLTIRVSSPDESFLSFDCFVRDHEIQYFAPSNSLFKIFLYIFFPVFLIALVTLFLVCIKLGHWIIQTIKSSDSEEQRRSLFNFKRAIVVSMICIIFLFHPTLTLKALSLFLCTEVDKDDYRMTHHMEYSCYSKDHIAWIAFEAIPTLLIWVIGLPLIALWVLIKYRKNLNEMKIQSYFLILYQGFRPECFYWEFLNFFKKFLLLSIHSLLNTFSVNYQIALSIVCLVGFFYFQKYMQPFKTKDNNQIDLLALSTGIVTIYSGLIFAVGQDIHEGFELTALTLITVFNGYFLLNWVYFLMVALEWKNQKFIYLVNTLGGILCKAKIDIPIMKSKKNKVNNKKSQNKKRKGKLKVYKKRVYPKRRKKGRTWTKTDLKNNNKKKLVIIEEEKSYED